MAEHLEYLVMDGEVVRYDQAVLHISTPAVRYGATAFEGVRAYWNDEEGGAVPVPRPGARRPSPPVCQAHGHGPDRV